jgi:hypothetical protein
LTLGSSATYWFNEHFSVGPIGTIRNCIRSILPKARLPIFAGLPVLVGLALYTSLSTGSATLNLVCRHNLRSADLSVSMDGKLILTDELSGSSLKRFGVFGKRLEGTFSKSLSVPSGVHVIDVHLTSSADGFDQTRRCGVTLPPGQDATLVISTQRGGLSLLPAITPPRDAGFKYSDSLRSILITAIGSVVSASVGFMVQEFLRSRKTA